MNAMSHDDRQTVERHYRVYRNKGIVHTGKWVYEPHDFESSFELWSEPYATRRAAYEAALAELPALIEMQETR